MSKKEVKLEVRITTELYQLVKEAAEKEESSCSAIVRKAIKNYFNNTEAK